MKRLLIIGCGDVVRRALPSLLRHWQVIALVRQRDAALAALGLRQIVGDLDDGRSLRRLSGIADAVLHSAPPPNRSTNYSTNLSNNDGEVDTRTRYLLSALSKSTTSLPRSLVYISTTGVYGDCQGAQIDETRHTQPRSARARRRVSAETQLRAFGRRTSCAVSILRAPGIYAADRLPLERLQKGLPVLLRDQDQYTNHIHADDLAAACVAALRRGRANRAYNVVDDTDVLMGDWFDFLADSFGLPRPARTDMATLSQQLSPMQLSFMGESRRIGNQRLKRELQLKLRYPDVFAGVAAILAAAA